MKSLNDLTIFNFRNQLINLINEEGLPASIVSYILKDIYEQMESVAIENARQLLNSDVKENTNGEEN